MIEYGLCTYDRSAFCVWPDGKFSVIVDGFLPFFSDISVNSQPTIFCSDFGGSSAECRGSVVLFPVPSF